MVLCLMPFPHGDSPFFRDMDAKACGRSNTVVFNNESPPCPFLLLPIPPPPTAYCIAGHWTLGEPVAVTVALESEAGASCLLVSPPRRPGRSVTFPYETLI